MGKTTKLVRVQVNAVRMDWAEAEPGKVAVKLCDSCRLPTRGMATISQEGVEPKHIPACLSCAMGMALEPVTRPFRELIADLAGTGGGRER